MTDIYVDNNFLDTAVISSITDYVTTTNDWVVTNDYWSEKFIHSALISNREIFDIILNISNKVKSFIEQKDNVSVSVETCQLVRWRKGDTLDPPHADCENLDGSPHPYPNRHYSVLIYLNTDYTGGQIFFPNQNLTPNTSPGTLVQFKGTAEYLHGVTQVTSGERYTIVLFLTKHD
jgi:predicted 2-oxoglutarate/Fe(II)-dependent dioxygenase YbiX